MQGDQEHPARATQPAEAGVRELQDRVLAAPLLTFDLPAQLEQLHRQPGYERGSPTGRTLVKERDLRIVLMALKAGGRLEEHQASGPISVQAITGRLRFSTAESSIELTAGHLLALEPSIPHDVEAVEDCGFLLTIGQTRYQDVSDHHEERG